MVLSVFPRVDSMNPKTFSIFFKVVNAEKRSTSYTPPGTVVVGDGGSDDSGGKTTDPVTCRVVTVRFDRGVMNQSECNEQKPEGWSCDSTGVDNL